MASALGNHSAANHNCVMPQYRQTIRHPDHPSGCMGVGEQCANELQSEMSQKAYPLWNKELPIRIPKSILFLVPQEQTL